MPSDRLPPASPRIATVQHRMAPSSFRCASQAVHFDLRILQSSHKFESYTVHRGMLVVRDQAFVIAVVILQHQISA
jgi:hypothetical protein